MEEGLHDSSEDRMSVVQELFSTFCYFVYFQRSVQLCALAALRSSGSCSVYFSLIEGDSRNAPKFGPRVYGCVRLQYLAFMSYERVVCFRSCSMVRLLCQPALGDSPQLSVVSEAVASTATS